MKSQYNQTFSELYDQFAGNRNNVVTIIKSVIKKYNSEAKSVFEIATGTGQLLYPFSKKYTVGGLDISKHMIKLAKTKMPHGEFIVKDAAKFSINRKYDIAFMLFDSINHIKTLNDWGKVFKNVKQCLNKDGIFLFDFNTKSKMEWLAQLPTQTKTLDNKKSMVAYKIAKKGSAYIWILEIFKKQGAKLEFVEREEIFEYSHSIEAVKKKFTKYFTLLSIFDERHKKPNQKSKRVYLVGRV